MSDVQFINNVLKTLRMTTKRKEKEEILSASLRNEHHGSVLYNYLWLSYNPYVMFGFHNTSFLKFTHIDTDFSSVLEQLIKESQTTKQYRKIIEQVKNVASQEYWDLIQMMLKKDLNCGIGLATINKTIPKGSSFKKLPVFKVAKAEEESHLTNMKLPLFMNEKYDGARSFIVITVGDQNTKTHYDFNYQMLTGSGREVVQSHVFETSLKEHLAPMYDAIVEAGGAIIDGEVIGIESGMMFDGKLTRMPRQKSNGIFNKMANGNASEHECLWMQFIAFDFILTPSYADIGVDKAPLYHRVGRLSFLPSGETSTIKRAPYHLVESLEDARKFSMNIISRGGEGAVAKSIKSRYELKRSKNWVKIKAAYDADVEVVGWTEHSKNPDMIGALMIASSDREVVGNIGTGKWLTHERRRELKTKADNDDLVGTILQIKFMEITTDVDGVKRFYIPRIEEERFDKDEADSYQKLLDMMP